MTANLWTQIRIAGRSFYLRLPCILDCRLILPTIFASDTRLFLMADVSNCNVVEKEIVGQGGERIVYLTRSGSFQLYGARSNCGVGPEYLQRPVFHAIS